MNTDITLSLFSREHWDAVREIYQRGMDAGNATFETTVPDLEVWLKKFHTDLLWVAMLKGWVVGWAGLQPVSVREVYRGVMEVTIYIHPHYGGQGIGTALMKHLVLESERAGVWSLYASVFPENTASIKLHEASGFRKIGYRERIAQMSGKWRNTVLYERRSESVGI